MKDRLDELITKYWSGLLTPSEQEEMERLLITFPEEWIKIGLLHKTRMELRPILSEADSKRIADKVLHQEKRTAGKLQGGNKKRFSVYKSGKWAGLFIIAVFLVFLGKKLLFPARQTINQQQVKTMDGMKTNLHLADGTEVWLNAGSVLKYPESFHNGIREVFLTGEAYFKVKHDPGRPFVIHTARIDAHVLGTELDIRAYPNEDFTEAALISGAVKVVLKDKEHSKSINLKPHQKIIVRGRSGDIAFQKEHQNKLKPLPDKKIKDLSKGISQDIIVLPVTAIDKETIRETAWRQNVLIYEDEPLEMLAKRLNRWYGVHIIIKDSALARQRFTGRADNISLERLLQILKMLKPFTYTIKENQVIIQ